MYSIIRTQKHKSTASLKSRETHTYRTRPTANADPAKLQLNKLLFGDQNYAEQCEKKLDEYRQTKHVRKDAVVAIEYLLTASPEFFEHDAIYNRQKNLDAWCEAQINFLKKMHGEENILCAYLHLDEKTPHIEAFVLPIDKKGKLNCKSFLGGSKLMSALQTSYALHNANFGLKRGASGSNATHQKVKQFYGAINQKSEINDVALAQALKLDKPSFSDKVNMEDYLAKQEKALHRRMTDMFKPIVQKAKLVERAERLVEADKKREEKMKAEKLNLENTIRQMQKDAEKLLAPLKMVELLQEENAELKKSLSWYEKENSALKLKAQEKKATVR